MLDAASTGKTRFREPTLTRASERSRARGKREGRAAPASSRAAARLGERRPSQRPLKAPLRRDRSRLEAPPISARNFWPAFRPAEPTPAPPAPQGQIESAM